MSTKNDVSKPLDNDDAVKENENSWFYSTAEGFRGQECHVMPQATLLIRKTFWQLLKIDKVGVDCFNSL